MFLEIILADADLNARGIGGRDEIEDPLQEAFDVAGFGEVTGGGSGFGYSNIDVEFDDGVRLRKDSRLSVGSSMP